MRRDEIIDIMPGLEEAMKDKRRELRIQNEEELKEAIIRERQMKRKSIAQDKIEKKKKFYTISKAVLATSLANLVIVLSVAGITAKQKENKVIQAKNSIVMSIYQDDSKSNIVERNTYQLFDAKGNIAYSTKGIAEDIVGYAEENPDTLNDVLYTVYSDMKYNQDENLTGVFTDLNIIVNNNKEEYADLYKRLAGTKTLEEYLVKERLVDSEGKASIDKLEDVFYNNIDYYINQSNNNGFSRS